MQNSWKQRLDMLTYALYVVLALEVLAYLTHLAAMLPIE